MYKPHLLGLGGWRPDTIISVELHGQNLPVRIGYTIIMPEACELVLLLHIYSINAAGIIYSIGVGTRGARGGPAPPIYKSGGARPPQCWSYQRYFNCENGFFGPHSSHFCNNFLGSSTNFNFKNFYTRKKTGMCTCMYTCICNWKNSAPPISSIFLLHCIGTVKFVQVHAAIL